MTNTHPPQIIPPDKDVIIIDDRERFHINGHHFPVAEDLPDREFVVRSMRKLDHVEIIRAAASGSVCIAFVLGTIAILALILVVVLKIAVQ